MRFAFSKSGLLLEAGFVQTAENAREIAVKNIDEEDAETARRDGLAREASSNNRADEESRRRLHAEATTADAVRQRGDRRVHLRIDERLQELLVRHFAAEDSLRSLEIADIEHRLEQVRAETERRRRERAELVRREVDEILRQAVRPE